MAALRKPTQDKMKARDESQGKTSEQFVADKQGTITDFLSSNLNKFLFKTDVTDYVKRRGGLVKADMGTPVIEGVPADEMVYGTENFNSIGGDSSTLQPVPPPTVNLGKDFGFKGTEPPIVSKPSAAPGNPTINATGSGAGYKYAWETPGAESPSLKGKPSLQPADANAARSLADQQKTTVKPQQAGNFISNISPPDPGMIMDLLSEAMHAQEDYKKKKYYETQMQIANTVPKYYGSKGDYDINQGNFRPDRRLATGKKGGQFGKGGPKDRVKLTNDEVIQKAKEKMTVAEFNALSDLDRERIEKMQARDAKNDKSSQDFAERMNFSTRAAIFTALHKINPFASTSDEEYDKSWADDYKKQFGTEPPKKKDFNAQMEEKGLMSGANAGGTEYNPAVIDAVYNHDIESTTKKLDEKKKGGGIHIKKSHEGRFTAYKKRTGKTTEEALHSKDPHVRAMANFARNAKKWKHADGGEHELPQAFWGALVSLIPAVMGMMNKNKEAQTAQTNQDTALALAKTKELDVQQQNSLGVAQGFQQNALQTAPLYKKGGQPKYKKGATVDLSEKEIADLVRQGYDLEFVD